MTQYKRTGRRNTDKVLDAIMSIRCSAHAQEIESKLSAGVKALAYEHWAMIIGTKTDRAIDHDDLIGLTSCSGAWFATYIEKHCIQIDPFFEYCFHSNHPITFPYDVRPKSAGQEGFLSTLATRGFVYGVAVPIHLAQARLAMFYAGTARERPKTELCGCAPLLSALGQEAAIWLESQRVASLRDNLPDLTDVELEHLSWVLKGFQTNEIAEFTKSTVSATNNVFRKINEKLGTNSRREAAMKAEKLGLWRQGISAAGALDES